jgi:hypothetical protein
VRILEKALERLKQGELEKVQSLIELAIGEITGRENK